MQSWICKIPNFMVWNFIITLFIYFKPKEVFFNNSFKEWLERFDFSHLFWISNMAAGRHLENHFKTKIWYQNWTQKTKNNRKTYFILVDRMKITFLWEFLSFSKWRPAAILDFQNSKFDGLKIVHHPFHMFQAKKCVFLKYFNGIRRTLRFLAFIWRIQYGRQSQSWRWLQN